MKKLMPDEYVKIMFPFLTRSLEDEWELIKQKKSTLSRTQRDLINNTCIQLEKEQKEHVHTKDCKHD